MISGSRYKTANREALITLGLYFLFFVWWTFFAFFYGADSPENYAYIFGLPEWFFYSCVLGYPLITFILWIVVRYFFSDIPLGDVAQEGAAPDALGVNAANPNAIGRDANDQSTACQAASDAKTTCKEQC